MRPDTPSRHEPPALRRFPGPTSWGTRSKGRILACAAIVAGLLVAGCTGTSDSVGAAAVPFAVTDIDGVHHTLADHEGKPVFLFFMTSWCSSCMHYSRGELQEIHDRVTAAGGFVLALSIEPTDTPAKLRQFAERSNSDWPYAIDEDQVWREYDIYAQSWGVAIDRDHLVQVSKLDPPKDEVFEALGV